MSPARVSRTLAELIRNKMPAFVGCEKCRRYKQIDLEALMAKVGPDYSLWNRRCKCRLKAGCDGWNKFWIGPGWHTPNWDDRTEERWVRVAQEARSRKGGSSA